MLCALVENSCARVHERSLEGTLKATLFSSLPIAKMTSYYIIIPVFHPTDCKLSTMNAVTSSELRCIILTSPPKSCELDPIPTFLLQEFVNDLLPFLNAL